MSRRSITKYESYQPVLFAVNASTWTIKICSMNNEMIYKNHFCWNYFSLFFMANAIKTDQHWKPNSFPPTTCSPETFKILTSPFSFSNHAFIATVQNNNLGWQREYIFTRALPAELINKLKFAALTYIWMAALHSPQPHISLSVQENIPWNSDYISNAEAAVIAD